MFHTRILVLVALAVLALGHIHITPASGLVAYQAEPANASSDPAVPDPNLTPGAVYKNATVAQICRTGYTRSVRAVSIEMKRDVFAHYHLRYERGHYEVDHLVSLELGGSNDLHNLWPESRFTQPWNANVKDHLENRLHDLVCSGRVPLEQAQQEIATNWIEAYKKYVSPVPLGEDGHEQW